MVTLNLLGLNTSTTCSKLHDLHKELNQQNQGVTEAYGRPILNQLLKLLDNKDKQVKILVCCCLADIFRIYAPEAPFNEKELVQIFTVFFRQLLFVKDPTGPLFPYYFYLLETISTIKCVCLLGQLRSADELISQLFSDFFEIISPEMTMTLQVCLRDVLYQLIEEFNFVSQVAVIELIVSHFSTKTQKSNPSAFRLAVDLCNMCDDKLQRYVCQYFGDVMIAASKNLDDEDTFKQFEVSHNLILEIFEHVPSLLLNVVPQLEEELKVETIVIRQMATDSLGKMFAKKGSKWVDTYPHIFKSWCDRRNDKNILIRVAWVKYTGSIVQLHPDMTQTMEPMLKSKLMDPDEKIRVAAIQAIGLVCQEHPNLLDDDTLHEVSNRCRDKKMAPRFEAIHILSKLFHNVYNISLQDSEMPLERFIWIPGSILELLYLEDQETRIMVEKVLVENIFPPNSDHTIRTIRLLKVLSSLNEKQHNAFLTVLDRQVKAISSFSIFIDQCVKFNSSSSSKDEVKMILDKVIHFLSQQLPDSKKAETHLRKFAELKDGRLYKLMRAVMDPTVEFKNVLKHSKEICSILGKHAGVLDTITVFLRRVSLCIVNKNLMEVLLGMIKNGKGELDKVAESFIKEISRIFPALYKNNISSFVSIITNPESKSELVDDTVEALAKFIKSFPDYFANDKEMSPLFPSLVESLVKLCLSGTKRQTKNAAIILAVTGCNKECRHILQKIVSNLTLNFKTLIPKLACIKSLAYYCNSEYSRVSSEVINLIVSKILMKNEKTGNGQEAEWTPFNDLEDEGKAKVLGLKILVKPLLVESPNNPPLVDIAKSVMKLCRTALAQDGELLKSGNTWASFKTHLRLNAGLAALKLLALPAYAEAFEADDFNTIGLLIQDPIYYVRSTFVERLIKYLVEEKLPVRYSMWLTLAAHEPEAALKARAKGALIRIAKSKRSADGVIKKRKLLETHFSDFCQLLSHHPDFSTDHEDLELFEVYIQFYLDTVATDENISYLYASAAQLKMVKDKYLEDSTSLYVIAEMLILRIREYCAQQNWTLVTYPGKFSISREFYLRLDDEEISNNLKKVFYKDGQERLQKMKRQPPVRTAAIKPSSSVEDEENNSSEDSEATQVDRKRVKLSSTKETPTATRRSERAKKPVREQRHETEISDVESY